MQRKDAIAIVKAFSDTQLDAIASLVADADVEESWVGGTDTEGSWREEDARETLVSLARYFRNRNFS